MFQEFNEFKHFLLLQPLKGLENVGRYLVKNEDFLEEYFSPAMTEGGCIQ